MNKIAYDMIKRHEGLKLKPYKDTKGLTTIGIGRNLDGKGITLEEAEYLFRNDLDEVELIASRLCPTFYTLTEGRQAALMNMAMMGASKLIQFKKMFAAIKAKDWNEAAKQALDSKWASDVKSLRANDVANLLRNG